MSTTNTTITTKTNLTVTFPVGTMHDLTKVLSASGAANTLEIIENYGDDLDGITIRIGTFNTSDELLEAVKEEVSKKAKKWKREKADCVFLRNQLMVHEGGYDYDYRMSINDVNCPEISSFLKEWCRSYSEREYWDSDDEDGEESEDE